MMAPLPLASADLDRLAKLLGMLGSDADGERANAAAAADALLRERGCTWADLVERLKDAQPGDDALAARAGSLLWWRQDARECAASAVLWSEREADFLQNIAWKRRPPTDAQAIWLLDLVERARATAREAA